MIRRRSGLLSAPAADPRPQEVLKAFIEANARAMTLHPSDLETPNARVARSYETAHNGMKHVVWQQQHDGLDIFGARLTLNLTKGDEIINVSSRALHIPAVRFHDATRISEADAVAVARERLGGGEVRRIIELRKVWYPLDMISAALSWEVAVRCSGNDEAHDMVIRADTGEVVFEQSLTWSSEDLSLNVYTNDSPRPMTPGLSAPTNWVPPEVPRTWITLAALDTDASPEGWIPAGSNELLGNNANIYADWDDNDQPDAPRLTGDVYRVFDESVDLTGPPTNYVEFSQVQAFYWANFVHDRLYGLGFDEVAGNFQSNNFGHGGIGCSG
ncbi:MAG: M36 family metallopeptidase [Kiritimatiellae bacterium]|nr:M36 family metallopeptidase [Kiritimatiellia bacterium]